MKDFVSSKRVSQILTAVPAPEVRRIRESMSHRQPAGIHARRHLPQDQREQLRREAVATRNAGAISQRACDYLTGWALGTLRRKPRPAEYKFLRYRWSDFACDNEEPRRRWQHRRPPRPISLTFPDNDVMPGLAPNIAGGDGEEAGGDGALQVIGARID